MKIGLFFGSFNPIHIGHVIIANYIVEFTDLTEVWFVVTPHNPFKNKSSLLNNYARLELVHLAINNYPKLKASNIEFGLPQPNYTINTLVHLQEKYPTYEFALIMGEDNLTGLPKWKNYNAILEHYQIYVYPRITDTNTNTELQQHPQIKHVNAPIIQLSSTFIRDAIKQGKHIAPMLPAPVWKYIDEMNFYK